MISPIPPCLFPETGQACGILGQMYKHLSRHDECMEMLKESDRIFRANEGESGPNVGVNLVCMGEVLKSQGKFREALAELDKGMAIYLTSPAFGPNHPNTGNMYCVKGDCHKGLGDYESAKQMYIKGIDVLQRSGASPADLSRELSSLGKVHHEQGELAKAKQMFEASLGIYRQAFGESDSRVADQLNHVGRVLSDQGAEFRDEALKLHLKAFKIKRRIIGLSRKQ
jgi:tetratricopeptide (TPR) repeat protein